MKSKLKDFVEELAMTEVTKNVYNQYSYEIEENEIRRKNLLVYLEYMHKQKPEVLLVGEAPGYRGCRLTGVPFTSEYLLMNNMKGMKVFGREAGYRLASNKEKLLKEATSTIIWDTIVKYNIMSLGWNAFPFHPHKEGNFESNRTPLKAELAIGEKPLIKIIEIYNIRKIVAVGTKAELTLAKLNISCLKVRHPAQGGKNEFVEGLRRIKSMEL
ncbi:uracil-DNA glycosylase [Candidatus Clostridium radicumherbarum]|uniref:Uracil-DNA glycosylase n=1 Tax=Candidatus Clostridium radicumherbarum TaxID=3381662 RepID=A0ABW8TPU2_9CLOT